MAIQGAENLSVVVLAAGTASRFGSPKQLASFHNKKLLIVALELAGKISENTVLVTGAYCEEIMSEMGDELKSLGVRDVYNPDWSSGMGTSIRAGISNLDASIEGALILLVDQPLVTESHLSNLVKRWSRVPKQDERPWAVATSYLSSVGVPALFDKRAFDELKQLDGDQGARDLLNNKPDKIVSLEPDFSLIDIDTPEQLELLKRASPERA